MIDIHCHILPGLDDGAKDLEESLQMCHIASSDDINTIVATPHTINGIFINERQTIISEVNRINNVLVKKNVPLKILPGADVHINYNIIELLNQGKALTINDNGSFILLEFPHQLIPPRMSEYLFNLQLNGITPIFSHPERNLAIQRDLNIIFNLIEQGALTQITAMSLTGEFGQEAYNCAVEMLRFDLVHIIASDAHSSNFRKPLLSRAVQKASEIAGPDYAQAMVTSIPQHIISGESPSCLPEPVKPKKSFFQSLFG